MRSAWGSPVKSQHAQGALLTNYTTAKSILNGQAGSLLEPDFWYPGKQMLIEVCGAISNIVTTPGLMNFQVKLGTLAAPITVFDTGNVQLNATAHTTLPFWLRVMLRCDSEGAGTTAKLFGVAQLTGVMFTKTAGQVDGVNSETVLTVPFTAPVAGTGFDSTIQNYLDLWAGFTIAAGGNGVRVDQYLPLAWDIP